MLKEFVGVDNLPSNYGGNAPPLSISVHPYEEVMRDYGDLGPGAGVPEKAFSTEPAPAEGSRESNVY